MTTSWGDFWPWLRTGRVAAPRPVVMGRYRYSKLRWRIAVQLIDFVGHALMRPWRRTRPDSPPPTPRRILVVQLDHLGDAVLTSPLIERLRAAYPEARIDLLASPSNREVFEADPRVDHVRLATRNWFERRGRGPMLSAVWSIGRSLRGTSYDLGIDIRGDILSVLVLAIAGVKRRVGWSMGGGGFLLTDVAEWKPGRHEVMSRLALLDCLKLPGEVDTPPVVTVHVRDSERIEVARRLRDAWAEPIAMAEATLSDTRPAVVERIDPLVAFADGRADSLDEGDWLHAGRFASTVPLLAVHLGAGTSAKRWPSRHWKTLIERYLQDGWRVVMVGVAEDSKIAEAITPHPDLLDWTGLMSVTETTALLECADLFIGSDSGPSHLAACARTPSVVLFSGTNRPGQWRPWSRRSMILKQAVPCRPCHQKVCPLADHPCMTGLDPDRVYRASRRWWARFHRGESSSGTF